MRKGRGASAGALSLPAWGDLAVPARRSRSRAWVRISVRTCAGVVSLPFDNVKRAAASIRGKGA